MRQHQNLHIILKLFQCLNESSERGLRKSQKARMSQETILGGWKYRHCFKAHLVLYSTYLLKPRADCRSGSSWLTVQIIYCKWSGKTCGFRWQSSFSVFFTNVCNGNDTAPGRRSNGVNKPKWRVMNWVCLFTTWQCGAMVQVLQK